MIDRIPAYSNKAKWDYCETLKKVVLQTKTTKTGRGKAVEIREVLKYNTDKELIKKIVKKRYDFVYFNIERQQMYHNFEKLVWSRDESEVSNPIVEVEKRENKK